MVVALDVIKGTLHQAPPYFPLHQHQLIREIHCCPDDKSAEHIRWYDADDDADDGVAKHTSRPVFAQPMLAKLTEDLGAAFNDREQMRQMVQ